MKNTEAQVTESRGDHSAKSVKILMLIDHFGSGGAQRQIVNLSKGLKLQGYDIEFAIYYPQFKHFESDVREAGIHINELKKAGRFSFKIVYSVCKLIRKKRFDLIISFLNTPNSYAEIASAISGVKCIVSERSAFPNNKISLLRYCQCYLHALAGSIVINSKSHQCAVDTAFPFLRKKTRVIYNIVEKEFFDIGNNRQAVKNDRVLSVGTINSNKNSILLINALYFLKQKYNVEICVTWAGKVGQSDEDTRFYKQCVELLKNYGISNQWVWAGEVSDITKLYHTHSILVHCSFFEGLPNAICEGMASGLIVLASNVNEHPNLLQDIDADLLFDPNDSRELGRKLYDVLNLDIRRKQELVDRTYNRARTFFDRISILEKFDQLIKSSIGSISR